jgi:hypothetical protein
MALLWVRLETDPRARKDACHQLRKRDFSIFSAGR